MSHIQNNLIIQDLSNSDNQKSFINTFLNAVPYIGALLDDSNRVLIFNDNFVSILAPDASGSIIGKRPGEIFGCINQLCDYEVCGSTPACQYCGIPKAIIDSQKSGCRTEGTVQLLTFRYNKNGALDLKVIAIPILLNGHNHTIITFEDLSAENRRRMFERIFFHDLTNSVGALMGMSEIFESDPGAINTENLNILSVIAKKIYDEIQSQRILLYAETNELAVQKTTTDIADLLKKVIAQMSFTATNQQKKVTLYNSEPCYCTTDIVLLHRVLINLLKNAIEAIQPGATIICDYQNDHDYLTISINNPGVIADEIKYHIFQRSFSTKGRGRGTGTYSVKLFTEQYLGGIAFFSSEPESGTTFFVKIPLNSSSTL